MSTAQHPPQAAKQPATGKSAQPRAAAVTRAITVLEPHALLLVSSFVQPGMPDKPVENRSLSIGKDFRGTVAIHASSNMRGITDQSHDGPCSEYMDLHPKIAAAFNLPRFAEDDKAQPFDPSSIFHPGCILGVVDIIGAVEFNPEEQDFEEVCRAAGYGDWYDQFEIPPGAFACGELCFLTANPKQFTQPIPCKGALNFWRLETRPGALAAVAAALQKPIGSPYFYRKALAAQSAAASKRKSGDPPFRQPWKPKS